MRKHLSYLTIIFVVIVLINSCNSHKIAEKSSVTGTWMAKSMYGNSIDDVDFMRGSPSIIFRDSISFDGSTGCNQYSAKYSEGKFGVKITIGPMTKMACPGDEESIFIKALDETNRVTREKDIMIFYNDDKEVLRFQEVL